jgi:thymidylate synthase (FAD)
MEDLGERVGESARGSTSSSATSSLHDAAQKSCGKCESETTGNTCEIVSGDEKLLKFLWDNRHSSPFEMAGATFEIQAPIFVFREWHRHRTQSYSELSARYTPLPDFNYIPSIERLMIGGDGKNKQAGTVKDAETLTEARARGYQAELASIYADAQEMYESALKAGVPKELARIHLPVGRYSRMRASTDLRNWLGFLALRCAPGAQWEIRQYANQLRAILRELFPRTLVFSGT